MDPNPEKGVEKGVIELQDRSLDATPAERERLRGVLSPEEEARAARFRSAELRNRYVVGRGWLRTVLAEYVGRPPGSLRFLHNEYGKPRLAEGPPFNVSHAGDRILVGVAREGRVGVDLEIVRAFPKLEALARRTFAAEETEALLALPPGDRVAAFYRVWTRKEAFIKAVGGGLSVPLGSFAVRPTPEAGNTLVRLDPGGLAGAPEAGADWWIAPVRPPTPGRTPVETAVAWDRGPARIRWRRWTAPGDGDVAR